MIRNYIVILVAIIAVAVLILSPALYFLGSSTVKATSSSQDQSSLTRPLIQNGYTQNHFVIDKSHFKKAPEFTGITGFVNTPAPIKLAHLKGKVVLVHFWTYTCIN
jgi:hypothetical protein